MKIIRSKVLGYCTGVRRAVEMALGGSSVVHCVPSSERQVYTLGPLIHNPTVLAELKARGIKILKSDELPPENSTVIIRAHGVSPQIEKAMVKNGVNIIDATCPHVKLSQSKAQYFAENSYKVFLAGEDNHAEIAGIKGYIEAGLGYPSSIDSVCFVVSNPREAEAAAEKLFKREGNVKTALIGQTTISPKEYEAIGEGLRRYYSGLEIVDSICGATAKRQNALRELCGEVDAIIIAGGLDSANTRRLLSLALDCGKPAWLVETPGDLPPEVYNYESVGLSAGASTPDSIIEGIEKLLNS